MLCDPREWIAVSLLPGIGPATLAKLTAQGISPNHLLNNHLPSHIRLRADARHALKQLNKLQLLDRASRILDESDAKDLKIITLDCDSYPALLKQIYDPPPLLWIKGNFSLLNYPQLAIVGSRKPTTSGFSSAYEFAKSLAGSGFVITSGLAQGVDEAAHKGAVSVNKPTLAVLGTSPELVYPRSNQRLVDRLLEQNGALVSEFHPGTRARPENFPKRNRIISGLSVGVLVVEAALKSGSLITARLALEQGREVFALPGSIHNPLAKGCHALIREGALLVENQQQISEALAPLLGYLATEAEANPPCSPLTTTESSLIDQLRGATMTLNELHIVTGVSISELQQVLINLQLDGKIGLMGDRYMALS